MDERRAIAPSWQQIFHALVGTALITAGSVAMNQWYEQRSDALMARTQGRPIPSGRVSSGRALSVQHCACRSRAGLLDDPVGP